MQQRSFVKITFPVANKGSADENFLSGAELMRRWNLKGNSKFLGFANVPRFPAPVMLRNRKKFPRLFWRRDQIESFEKCEYFSTIFGEGNCDQRRA